MYEYVNLKIFDVKSLFYVEHNIRTFDVKSYVLTVYGRRDRVRVQYGDGMGTAK